MTDHAACLYYDFVDPVSRVWDRRLRRLEGHGLIVDRIPFEWAPEGTPYIDPSGQEWAARWHVHDAGALELGLSSNPPRFVPRSAKAIELVLLAQEQGHRGAVHDAIFDAFFEDGADIGRIDVLVEIAAGEGLDRSMVKAVLDVDRHRQDVVEARADAERRGVRGVPTLVARGQEITAWTDPEALRGLFSDQE